MHTTIASKKDVCYFFVGKKKYVKNGHAWLNVCNGVSNDAKNEMPFSDKNTFPKTGRDVNTEIVYRSTFNPEIITASSRAVYNDFERKRV